MTKARTTECSLFCCVLCCSATVSFEGRFDVWALDRISAGPRAQFPPSFVLNIHTHRAAPPLSASPRCVNRASPGHAATLKSFRENKPLISGTAKTKHGKKGGRRISSSARTMYTTFHFTPQFGAPKQEGRRAARISLRKSMRTAEVLRVHRKCQKQTPAGMTAITARRAQDAGRTRVEAPRKPSRGSSFARGRRVVPRAAGRGARRSDPAGNCCGLAREGPALLTIL